jgi:hypothetical protein
MLGWWLVVGGWWLVVGGRWWSVVGVGVGVACGEVVNLNGGQLVVLDIRTGGSPSPIRT